MLLCTRNCIHGAMVVPVSPIASAMNARSGMTRGVTMLRPTSSQSGRARNAATTYAMNTAERDRKTFSTLR